MIALEEVGLVVREPVMGLPMDHGILVTGREL